MRIIWDESGKRIYETALKNGILYPQSPNGSYPMGYCWNGLTAVNESPSGAESNPLYADSIKYADLISAEVFAATVEAYMYPDEFAACDGSIEIAPGVTVTQQTRKAFGLVYVSLIGNDVAGTDLGYKINIIYGAKAAPSEKSRATVNDSPEAMTLSWELSTTPVSVPGLKPTAMMVINSTKIPADKLKLLEDVLYGTDTTDPRLPLPNEIMEICEGSVPGALSIASIVPADGSSTATTTSTVVITFSNRISADAVMMMTNTGVIVPVTKTLDTTGKIMTITPTDDLASATTYLVSVSGIVDIYGGKLEPTVKKFTTVAG